MEEVKMENKKDEKESKKKSRNPAIRRVEEDAGTLLYTEGATTKGAAIKSMILLLLVFSSAGISFVNVIEVRSLITIIVMAFLTGLYLCFHPEMSSILAPVYALLEGVSLGQISAISEKAHPGIVLQALIITFGIAAMVIFVYSHEIFKINPIFTRTVFLVTGGIAFLYLVDLVLILGFGMNVPLIHDMGWKGILFSLFAIVVATSNLAIDYVEIRSLTEKGLPEYYEWYFAYGFMLSLIWMYLEVLRLERKLK